MSPHFLEHPIQYRRLQAAVTLLKLHVVSKTCYVIFSDRKETNCNRGVGLGDSKLLTEVELLMARVKLIGVRSCSNKSGSRIV